MPNYIRKTLGKDKNHHQFGFIDKTQGQSSAGNVMVSKGDCCLRRGGKDESYKKTCPWTFETAVQCHMNAPERQVLSKYGNITTLPQVEALFHAVIWQRAVVIHGSCPPTLLSFILGMSGFIFFSADYTIWDFLLSWGFPDTIIKQDVDQTANIIKKRGKKNIKAVRWILILCIFNQTDDWRRGRNLGRL